MGKSKAKSTVKKEDKVAPRLQVTRTDTGKTGTAIPLVPKTALGHAIITFKNAVEDRINHPSEEGKDLIKLFDAAYSGGKDGCVSLMRFCHPYKNNELMSCLEFIYHVDDQALTLHVLRKTRMGRITSGRLITNFPNAHRSLHALLIYLKEDCPYGIPVERRIFTIISMLLAETLTKRVNLEEPLEIMMNLGILPHVNDAKQSNDKSTLEHLAQYAHMILSPEFAKRVMTATGVDSKASGEREECIVSSLIDRPQYKHKQVIMNFIDNFDLTKYIESINPEMSTLLGDFIVKIMAHFNNDVGTKLFEKYPALYLHPININPGDPNHTHILSIIESMTYFSETDAEKVSGLACFKAILANLVKNSDETFVRRVLNDRGMGAEPGPLEFAAKMEMPEFIPPYIETGLMDKDLVIEAYYIALKHNSPKSAKAIRSSFKKQHKSSIFKHMDAESITRAAVLSALSLDKDISGGVVAMLDHIKPASNETENEDALARYADAFRTIMNSLNIQAHQNKSGLEYFRKCLKGLLAQARQDVQAYEMLFMAITTSARQLLLEDEYSALYEETIRVLLEEKADIRPHTDFSRRAAHTLSMLYFETKTHPTQQEHAPAIFRYLFETCPANEVIELIATVTSDTEGKLNQPDEQGIRQFGAREEYFKLAVQLILAEDQRPSDSLLAQAGLLGLADAASFPAYRDAYLEANQRFVLALSVMKLFDEIMQLYRAGVLSENAMPILYVYMDPEDAATFFTQAILDKMLQNPVQDDSVFNAFIDKLVAPRYPSPDSRIMTTVYIFLYLIGHPKYINSLVKAIELYKPKFEGSDRMADFLYEAAQVPNIQFIRRYGHQFTQKAIKTALSHALVGKQWEAAVGLLQLVDPENAELDEYLLAVAQSRHAGLITALVQTIGACRDCLSLASTYETIREIDSHLDSLKNKQPEYAKPLRQLREKCADHFLKHALESVLDDFYPSEVAKTPWNKRLGTALMLMKKYPACQEIIAKKFKEVHNNEAGHKDLGKMHHAMMKKSQTHPLPAHQQKMHEALGRSTAVVRFSGASHSAGAKPVENNGPSTSASRPSQPPSSQMQRRRRK